MTRDEFIFSVGFQGEYAIVDGKARKENKGLSTAQLIDKGLFRAAFCSALFDNNTDEMRLVLDTYNQKSGSNMKTVDDMKRMFGIYTVPDGIKNITVIN